MKRPDRILLDHSVWNDGYHPYTVIRAEFDTAPKTIPEGWECIDNFVDGIAYEKHFPYGTTVRKGHIVVWG